MAELRAITNVIDGLYYKFIVSDEYDPLPANTLINIYTDSDFCYKLFQPISHPNYNQYYLIINRMYDHIYQFYKYGVYFAVHKVLAHQDNNTSVHARMNNEADKLAKQKLQETKNDVNLDYYNAKYNYCFYNNNNLVKVYYRLKERQYTQNYQSRRSTNQTLFNINHTKEMLKESRFLSYKDTKLLSTMRMGYMQIPGENRFIEPVCACGVPLTTQHFLIECQDPGLVERRAELKNELETRDAKYNEKLHNLMNPNATNDEKMDMMTLLLYPHLHYNYNQLKQFPTKLIKYNNLKMLLH